MTTIYTPVTTKLASRRLLVFLWIKLSKLFDRQRKRGHFLCHTHLTPGRFPALILKTHGLRDANFVVTGQTRQISGPPVTTKLAPWRFSVFLPQVSKSWHRSEKVRFMDKRWFLLELGLLVHELALRSMSQISWPRAQGWWFPSFRFSRIIQHRQNIDIDHHVNIWQISPQLSCGDTCQIWMLFKESKRYFCKIEMSGCVDIET